MRTEYFNEFLQVLAEHLESVGCTIEHSYGYAFCVRNGSTYWGKLVDISLAGGEYRLSGYSGDRWHEVVVELANPEALELVAGMVLSFQETGSFGPFERPWCNG